MNSLWFQKVEIHLVRTHTHISNYYYFISFFHSHIFHDLFSCSFIVLSLCMHFTCFDRSDFKTLIHSYGSACFVFHRTRYTHTSAHIHKCNYKCSVFFFWCIDILRCLFFICIFQKFKPNLSAKKFQSNITSQKSMLTISVVCSVSKFLIHMYLAV